MGQALTAKQIESIIEDWFSEARDFNAEHVYDSEVPYRDITDWSDFKYEVSENEPLTIPGLDNPVFKVDSHGGGEGSGETMYVVIGIGDRFFRKDGFYASFDGANWDGTFREVVRETHVVKIFRPVDK